MNENKVCQFECSKCLNFKAKRILDVYVDGHFIGSKYMGDEPCMANCENANLFTFYNAPNHTIYEMCKGEIKL